MCPLLQAHLARGGVGHAAEGEVRVGGGLGAALDGGAGAGQPRAGVEDRRLGRGAARADVRDRTPVYVEEMRAERVAVVALERGEEAAVERVLAHGLGRVLGQCMARIVVILAGELGLG